MSTPVLSAENLTALRDRREAVQGVSLTVAAGEVVGLIGPNGSGKSTSLQVLAGLHPAARGEVKLDGRVLSSLTPTERARHLAYLPQNPQCHWPLSVRQVVALGRLPHRGGWGGGTGGADDMRAVAGAMERLDVTELAGRPVNRLSGGEKMRVMLARALAVEPLVLLADEPVDGLDPYHQLHVMELLRQLAGEGRGVLVVLHELSLAERFCDRLVLLHAGRVLASGRPADVLTPSLCACAYGIETAVLSDGDRRALVPWRRLTEEGR